MAAIIKKDGCAHVKGHCPTLVINLSAPNAGTTSMCITSEYSDFCNTALCNNVNSWGLRVFSKDHEIVYTFS